MDENVEFYSHTLYIPGHAVLKIKVRSIAPYSLNPNVCHRAKCTENPQVIAKRRIPVTAILLLEP